jgi:hypothetical protein
MIPTQNSNIAASILLIARNFTVSGGLGQGFIPQA